MNIRIRKMTVSDLEPLYKLLSNSKVMQYLEAPYTKEQTEQFLFRFGLSETPLIYAVEKDNDFIGYVIYHDYDSESVEIGWWLSNPGLVAQMEPEYSITIQRVSRLDGF